MQKQHAKRLRQRTLAIILVSLITTASWIDTNAKLYYAQLPRGGKVVVIGPARILLRMSKLVSG